MHVFSIIHHLFSLVLLSVSYRERVDTEDLTVMPEEMDLA